MTDPGLVVELVASEPQVRSPSALAWDAEGRLYVAENPGYPVGPGAGKTAVGTIVALADGDGDGRCEGRTVFAEGFGFPNGLMPWRGGWLVTDAPNLWWLADTNRDGRADVREVWFTGFATNQTTQLRACYPTFGPDGWIYVARGWSGGVVTSPKWKELPPVDLAGGDFRFRPDGSAAEAIGGNSQFGMVIDDVGRRFSVSNRNPLMQAVVHPRWWRRVAGLPGAEVMQDVSPTGYEAKVFPISPDTTTAGYMPEFLGAPHAGTFTAACGIHWFHGEGLPAEYQGSWFVCEPAQSLVQRQVASPVGSSFRSVRVPEDRDFLASSDGWFRPVYAATGPDGALYFADFYRKVIDHPEYLPAEVRGRMDFEAGKDLGRIWRVRKPVPSALRVSGAVAELPSGPLAGMASEHLAVALSSVNGWVRQTAHRLLFERGGGAEVGAVRRVWTNSATGRIDLSRWEHLARAAEVGVEDGAWGQARRLWLLGTLPSAASAPEGLAGALLAATFDPSPLIRETAWRVWQTRIVSAKHALPDVPYEMVRAWAEDPNPAVRFQFALVCGEQEDWTPVVPALVGIARRDGENRWARLAVASGLAGREAEFVRGFLEPPIPDTPAVAAMAGDLARWLGGRGDGGTAGGGLLLEAAISAGAPLTDGADDGAIPGWPLAVLRGYSEGLRGRGGGALGDLLGHPEPAIARSAASSRELPRRLEILRRRLTRVAGDRGAGVAGRVESIRVLAELGLEGIGGRLQALLVPSEPVDVQVAVVRALARTEDPAVGRAWLEASRWNSFGAPVREAVLAELTGRAGLLPVLFDALERGALPVWMVDPQRRRQLRNHAQPVLRERARKVFAEAGGADRRQALERLLPVAGRAGSGKRGREVFLRVCATCHQHGGEGVKVGPDLTGVRNQPPEALLLHIVVPDAEVAPGYQACEVETRDGRSLTGLLVAETGDTITLRRAGGEQETLGRANVASVVVGRLSLMPQELETTMSEQELADLLAFLRGQP